VLLGFLPSTNRMYGVYTLPCLVLYGCSHADTRPLGVRVPTPVVVQGTLLVRGESVAVLYSPGSL
jgi:hypothetical protein